MFIDTPPSGKRQIQRPLGQRVLIDQPSTRNRALTVLPRDTAQAALGSMQRMLTEQRVKSAATGGLLNKETMPYGVSDPKRVAWEREAHKTNPDAKLFREHFLVSQYHQNLYAAKPKLTC